MKAWIKDHAPEALLVAAGIGVGVVSAFSDVGEVVPWGHEVGIAAGGLGFSYLAAYIFNWLVVVRPRAAALRSFYEATWFSLCNIAMNAPKMVDDLEFLADQLHSKPVTVDYLRDVCSRIGFGDLLTPPQVNVRQVIQDRLKWHSDEYRKIEPILHAYEPAVSAALAEVNGATIFFVMDDLPYEPGGVQVREPGGTKESNLSGYVLAIADYWVASDRLRKALDASRYTPGKVAGGAEMLLLQKLNWNSLHGR
ncbi:hypothetical protein [Blastococcus sp. VKM Ac-2987]|uniref:hypothetical protein n=1 Tax=Blastococcus sp. VKM Ac-2987 TaxID=3004141 RepID=UPI0022AB86FB|nr:hypothetical protein [Blastococcus sp. VKM Ac-2987]MCZ2857423.1 hypothetical protein [Blastococcus sp. VKM Ac-2987]